MPSSAIFIPDGDPHDLYAWTEAYVVYSPDDLDDETELTVDCYFQVPSGIVDDTTLIQCRGAPEDVGRRHFSVEITASGAIALTTNATAGAIDANTATGVVSLGSPHHLMLVWKFSETGLAKVKAYLDGSFVAWSSYVQDSTPPTKFENYSSQSRYFLGWRNFAGTSVADGLVIDYVRAWTGTAATALQAAEYGGAFRRDGGTLGTPTHLWDFESSLADTGSSPFTIYYDQNITFGTDAIHPEEPQCESLTFAQSVEAEDASWVVWATIEGIGETAALGEYDQLYRFCSTIPHFAEASALWLPWLAAWPEILAEGAPKEDGGVVEAGELTLSLVDIEDRLTALWATEALPVTYAAEALPVGNNTFDVADASGIAVGDILYMGSECMFVEAKAGNELNVARACLDTTLVDHEAGAPVYVNKIPYLLSRRVRLYLAPADSCDGSEAVEIGQYKIDQKDLDETMGTYVIRGPSQVIFSRALVGRRQPDRFRIQYAYSNGKIRVVQRPVDQAYSAIRYWDPDERFSFLRFGQEIAIAENISTSAHPLFQLRDRNVLGSTLDDPSGAEFVEVVFGADPEPSGSGAQPTFFRYAAGPTPASVRNGSWTPSAHWIDIILNLLTSSTADEDNLELANRVAAYGAWDCLPAGLGIGVPAASIDFASALALRYRTPDYLFPNFVAPQEPVTFGELVTEEFLRPIGAYLITTGGQARIVMPRVPLASDTSFTIGPTDILTERVGERLYSMGVRLKQDMSELVSSLVYRFGRGQQAPTLTINDVDFDKTYGSKGHREAETRRREVTVPSVRPDFDGGVDWIRYRAMATLVRKRYPATSLTYRTSGLSKWAAQVGDVGEVTHGQIPNLSTGTRGVVGQQVELRSRTVSIKPGGVHIDHTVRVERNGRYGLIAPAARIVSVSADGSNRVITVSTNRFTEASADEAGLPDTDAEAFEVGDKLELHNRDGSRVTSSTSTVTAVGTNSITVNGDFGGALDTGTTDAGLVLRLSEYANANASAVEQYVYLADSTTREIDGEASPWQYAEV